MIIKDKNPKFGSYRIKELFWYSFCMGIICFVILPFFFVEILKVEFQRMLIGEVIIFSWLVLYKIEKELKEFLEEIATYSMNIFESIEFKNGEESNLVSPQFKDFKVELSQVYSTIFIFLVLFYATSYFTHILFTNYAWGSVIFLSFFYILLGRYLIIDKFLNKYFKFLNTKGLNFDKLIKTDNRESKTMPFLKDWLRIGAEGIILTMLLIFLGNLFSILIENHLWFVYIFIGVIYVIARRAFQLISFLNRLSDDTRNQCEIKKGNIERS